MAGFGVSDFEYSGSSNRELLKTTIMPRTQIYIHPPAQGDELEL
jgi:hypothetical protein